MDTKDDPDNTECQYETQIFSFHIGTGCFLPGGFPVPPAHTDFFFFLIVNGP